MKINTDEINHFTPHLNPPPQKTVLQLGVGRKPKAILRWATNWIEGRGAVEGALERNLLTYKIIRLFTIQRSFSIIRTVAHNLQIDAILKLPKLALCPLFVMMTQSPRGEGWVEVMSFYLMRLY